MSTAALHIDLTRCAVRSWRGEDVESLVRYADNRSIARNLRDSFPHPYTEDDARDWVQLARTQQPQTDFAIVVDAEAVGCIGFELKRDIFRKTAEVGYWLGEPFWGRGICTEVLSAMTEWAFETLGVQRIYAGVFSNNPASARVLHKAGYVREARLHRAIYKDGCALDELVYAQWFGMLER